MEKTKRVKYVCNLPSVAFLNSFSMTPNGARPNITNNGSVENMDVTQFIE